jgi:hypothetical protein
LPRLAASAEADGRALDALLLAAAVPPGALPRRPQPREPLISPKKSATQRNEAGETVRFGTAFMGESGLN